MTPRHSLNFAHVASVALAQSDAIVRRWLPDGRRAGAEWWARNPKRADRRLGSFKINLRTGLWCDFASGDSGGDLISLAAFLFNLRQDEAAKRVAEMIGVSPYCD